MALQEEFKVQGDFLFRNRSYLPLVILVIGLGVFIHNEYQEIERTKNWIESNYEFGCLGLSILGLLIRVLTIGYAANNSSGRNTREGQIADELNITGIYSMVRHPLYLGNFFMWLGVAMLTSNLWFIIAFVLFYAFYYERIMYAEESFLRNKFGNDYLDWADRTPAFIPSFKHYKLPLYRFNWKKALKQEKNGFAAVFLLFWVFELVGDLIESKNLVLEFDFWFYAAIISTTIYFALKILKKKKLLE